MKILITGAAGFLGQQLIDRLLSDGSIRLAGAAPVPITAIVGFDQVVGRRTDPRLTNIAGDISDHVTVESLVDESVGAVFHLAAVVSGTAEADFDLGMRVNLDGTRLLLEAMRHRGQRPVLLFSSSIAVFGGDLPAVVDDHTTPTPQGSYGIQKLAGELLVQDYSRKGFVDGRCVRVPTVVVRPGAPNGAASGFASGIIREPLAGLEAVLPVGPETEMWVASPRAVVDMFLHAIALPESAWGWHRSINLPGLTVSMTSEIDALRRIGGDAAVARIRHEPDERIMRLVRTWAARFDPKRATSMGFKADADFDSIVREYVETNPSAIRS